LTFTEVNVLLMKINVDLHQHLKLLSDVQFQEIKHVILVIVKLGI